MKPINSTLRMISKHFTALLFLCTFLFASNQSFAQCAAEAGTLAGFKPTDCLQLPGGTLIGGIPNGDAVVPAGYQTGYLLSQGVGLTIVDEGSSNIFNVLNIALYTVHTYIYDPATFDPNTIVFGSTTVFDVNAQFINGGGPVCGDVDLIGTSILVDNPDAGTITADSATFCLNAGSATITATPDGNSYAPFGYVTMYVLTQNPGAVIVNLSNTPVFQVSTTGDYAIHTLIFDPSTMNGGGIQFGVTTAFDVNATLIQGGGGICAALDMIGAPISVVPCTGVCAADAGSITADSSLYCWNGNGVSVSATPSGTSVVPAGFQTLYVLTEGAGLVIVDAQASPNFTVSDSGAYTIHTLVYDPNSLNPATIVFGSTTGFDVNALLLQGGGTICASLDVSGAPFSVVTCTGACLANAGTLTADSSQYCIDNSGIWISATPDGNAVVPPGYQAMYILTSGSNFVIEQFCPAPIFAVHDTGCYTIHTLVFDPNTLNLGALDFGTSVAFDVVGLITQNGGICASLDVVGAPICVVDCANLCLADAGTLTADSVAVCGNGGSAVLSAMADGNMNVPAGFQVLYVLTDAATGIIQQVNGIPSFTVSSFGNYIIHTLVYDPNTLDISTVMVGVTTGSDVNSLLSVGSSGAICGDLDVAGALVSYYDCSSGCTAFAGTITPDFTAICYSDSTPALLTATHNGNWSVPAGYQVAYVLTMGQNLVVQGIDSVPAFSVSDSGEYYIHTIVFDPSMLPPGSIVLGTTTGFDVNALLIQGGGTICGSLDVAGAYFDVLHCSQLCSADAGSHTPVNPVVCFDPAGVVINATADANQVIPPGYLMGYALTYGPNLIVQQAAFTPVFTVVDTGIYRIHALVYDPVTLNLSVITPGTTAAIDLVGLLIQGGGTICASLDLPGAQFYVDPCLVTSIANQDAEQIKLWPNPTSEQLFVEVSESVSQITIYSASGAIVQQIVNASTGKNSIDITTLTNGFYTIELIGKMGVQRSQFQVAK